MTSSDPLIVYEHLPTGVAGFYNFMTRTIIIDPRYSAGTQRATIAHEMIHHERNDRPCEDPWFDAKQEQYVERETAKRLISVDDLKEGAKWCTNMWELSEYLEVDKGLIEVRLSLLSVPEQMEIFAVLDDRCL